MKELKADRDGLAAELRRQKGPSDPGTRSPDSEASGYGHNEDLKEHDTS